MSEPSTTRNPESITPALGMQQELDLKRQEISILLRKSLTERDKKKQWAILELLRERSKWLRENRWEGFGAWWPVAFAAGMCACFVWLGTYETHHGRYSFGNRDGSPGDTVQILKRFDARRYQMRWVRGTERTPFVVSFCEDVPFSAGETLTWLSFQERSDCDEVLNPMTEFGYVFARDAYGKPTLSPNCAPNDQQLIECHPNFTEANFQGEN